MPNHVASPLAYSLIREYEKFSSKPYLCPAGVPTIGYGSTHYESGKPVGLKDIAITELRANVLLSYEIEKITTRLNNSLAEVPVTQGMFDALVSFCYNVGVSAFLGSTLLKKLRRLDYVGARNELERWCKGTVDGKKVVLRGLLRRRKAEQALWDLK